MMAAVNKVLPTGPGDGMRHSEKTPRMIRMRYCPSSNDHLCCRRAANVSDGANEVFRAEKAADDGDCRLRILDRNFRRTR